MIKNNKDTSEELNKEIQSLDKNVDELEKTINDLEIKASLLYEEENLEKSDLEKKLNKKSNLKLYELIIIGIFISMISILITKIVIDNKTNSYVVGTTKNNDALSEFEEVYTLIRDSYYKKVDDNKLIDGAISGMLSSLGDSHTSYFNEESTQSFNEVMNGSYEGIGAEISVDNDGNIIILSAFKNSPAGEAGLKFNDKILEVNGKTTKGLTTTEVVALIKDKNHKTAKMKINRDGTELTFDLERRNVILESVESKILERNGKKIGYVIINNFANNTYEQFNRHIMDLEAKSISGLVIDVRNNSGGYLHSVTSMLDMFVPKGTIMYKIKDQKKTTPYVAGSLESRNYPISVLINKSSASASEILAIGLKEAYGATVVGTYSYGKGTVQTTKELKTGGMIKYTIQKWLSPKGKWINEVGVEPNVQVDLNESYEINPSEENDNQLQRALDEVSK